ncbi:hypothetical protein WNJ89_005209 [Escherichia coli]|nr:hypothetical protein [Escherichia coli]HDQ6536123.1 hypothetical protein [Escherichia coli O36:H14]
MMCNRKRWSREDREFIEASVGKMTVEEMAKKTESCHNRPPGTCQKVRNIVVCIQNQ